MLAGKGFTKIYNLSGGIKAWEKATAVGSEDQGMEFFTGQESAEDSIIAAYGLEEGLREFYLTMQDKTSEQEAINLFAKLADIEILHQERLVQMYNEMTGKEVGMADFSADTVAPALEGGMSTQEYLDRFHPDLNSTTDILSLAMSIEAQALDLYQRASDKAKDVGSRDALQQIANEERAHLQRLADYMDQIA